MTSELEAAVERLSSTQQRAVNWDEGAALVLAGPGAGKTTVLTTRIARILNDTENRNFRILALTFTTKAGDEMRTRVETMVDSLAERTVIGTFHSFCAQMLRQHGSHLGIKPDFGIYDQDDDREELLRDALQVAISQGKPVTPDDVRWLKAIDRFRSKLIQPDEAAGCFRNAEAGKRASYAYAIYENALRENNVTDFHGMIVDTCRLIRKFPAVATRIRQSYPYWLIDEFQDTLPAQYGLVRLLAGEEFKNVFVVADEDQIIYRWAGASYGQIDKFCKDFSPETIQLIENRRCPPKIVEAANNLIANNVERTPKKKSVVSAAPDFGSRIKVCEFSTDADEANFVAREISRLGQERRGETAVLARTRAVLDPVLKALKSADVEASIVTRRDRFVSPQFIWLQSCLELSLRPTDRRMFITMVGAANRISGVDLDGALLAAEAESSGVSYLELWALAARDEDNAVGNDLAELALQLVESRNGWRKVVEKALDWLPTTAGMFENIASDAEEDGIAWKEDKDAWERTARTVRSERGSPPDLNEFLQQLALRPKEPQIGSGTVRLSTIHAAKGLEFENVWLVGVADDILPSWQSLKRDADPAELEEERRNFFVAITRTKKDLNISYAGQYRGRSRRPSRFIAEMGLKASDPAD